MTAAVKTDQSIQVLIKLHKILKTEDVENANKLVELVNKLYNDKLYIAFAGHFSAGKSSMINKLLDEQVLPTSPIPTSANLVLLEKGKEQVTLYSNSKESIELSGNYSIEQIKEYCKQGDEIERVHIKKPYHHLSDNVLIMDTPGIDSTDAAHKLSTESMLHIADVIFYVTDYNHVQSEENLSFVKEMKEKDKMIFLIVNQIDKHVESEVPFTTFKNQIESSFANIGLHEQDIFYTTLMNDDHEHNQLKEIKEIIRVFVENKEDYLDKNVMASVHQLINEHLEKYQEQLDLADIDKKVIQTSLENCMIKKNEMNGRYAEELNKIKELSTEINDRVTSILKSSNIIPYETREKAAAFIEAIDPSFKVGFLFSKSKTIQERENRKKELFEDLKKNVETQITWHFTPLFKEFIKKYDIHDQSFLQQVQAFNITLSEQIVDEAIKPGASYNNQYILTYSTDVSDLIKRHSKNAVMTLFNHFIKLIEIDRQEIFDQFTLDLKKCEEELQHFKGIEEKIDHFLTYKQKIQMTINHPSEDYTNSHQWIKENELYKHRIQHTLSLLNNTQVEEIKKRKQNTNQPPKNMDNKDQFIVETQQMIKRLKNIRGFKQFTDSLEKRVDSYQNRSFTVALFGAFSAGKSSFANALIGERLLPSSPTPTTATINKIAPPTEKKKHGLVEVMLKTEEDLLKEVFESIPSLSNQLDSLQKIIDSIKELALVGKEQTELDNIKKYKIALEDYQRLTENGLVITSSKDSFKDFVAKEEKACLVKEVIVYFDCQITKAGITLVDTPGADSLHKRHTDVAFQYIKSADAILYVTYYNHPFSKGDREFLRQLGRVKDSFTLDKMFFIINAIDLAKDEQEVELVKEYIGEQLLQQEIRNIRLFGVSSLNIQSNQLENEKDYEKFKEQFNYFITQELTNTTIISINEDLKRANERLLSLIHAAEHDEAEKEKIKQKLLEEKQNVNNELSALSNSHMTKNVKQEIEELIFYVKQRLFLRFNDFFKESFHPGMFTQNTNIQQTLLTCLNELIRTIEFELIQELQATTLRIENYIRKALEDEFLRISQLIKKHSQSVTLTKNEVDEILTPHISVEFSSEVLANLKPSLKIFKNTKSFFEKNEKKIMSEDLLVRFDVPVSVTLERYVHDFIHYYEDILNLHHSTLIEAIQNQTDEGFEALLDISSEDTKDLVDEQARLKNVINLLNV